MRPGGAGARPPSGPFPTDRDSLLSIAGGLATMLLAIGLGLMLSGILPEAASVIESPSPQPSLSLLPSPSASASSRPERTPRPTPEIIGTVTFGRAMDLTTKEILDRTDTFTRGDQFCHSITVPRAFGVDAVQEEIVRIDGDDLTVVQRRQGPPLPADPNASVIGFCVSADDLVDDWGTGDFVLSDYRRKDGLQLIAQGRFTLTE
jgi:hypothetical protein